MEPSIIYQHHRDEVAERLGSFTYEHLPEKLQEISKPFCDLAQEIAERAPHRAETVDALRALMQAKDCAVRAALA